jgi:putative transposase
MRTFCEQTMRVVYAELDVERVEFNGEADHVHPLVAYPPTLALCVLAPRLKARTAYAVRREFTGVCVRARMRGHHWSPSCVAVSSGGAPPSIIKQYHRRTSPTTLNAGLRPAIHGIGSPRTEVRGWRPGTRSPIGLLLLSSILRAAVIQRHERASRQWAFPRSHMPTSAPGLPRGRRTGHTDQRAGTFQVLALLALLRPIALGLKVVLPVIPPFPASVAGPDDAAAQLQQ